MKVLVIWKALVSEAYHKRFIELAKLKDVELTLIVPTRWHKTNLEKGFCNEYKIIPTKIVLSGYNHFHWYPRLEKYVRQIRPDIFHIEEEHYSFVTYQAIKLAKKYNIKCLFVTWQNIYKKYPFPFSRIEQYNLENADYAIAGSNEVRKVLVRKGFDNKRISMVPLGADTMMFHKMESTELRSKLQLEVFTIGYLGRFVIEKGIMDLLQAVSLINSDFNLLLVGSGKLRHKIKEKGRRLDRKSVV